MTNNPDGLLSSVISWGKVIGIIIAAMAALILLGCLMIIICAGIKRAGAISKIKKAARKIGWEFEARDNTYNVISANGRKYELRLKKGEKTINVKLLSCLHPRGKYILNGLDEFIGVNSFSPLLHAQAPYVYYKSPESAMNPKYVSVSVEKSGEYAIDPQFPGSEINAENVICFSPIAHEIMGVDGNQTTAVGNGDVYQGCLLFSGSGLVKYLENGMRKK